jgi:hypothetical protein
MEPWNVGVRCAHTHIVEGVGVFWRKRKRQSLAHKTDAHELLEKRSRPWNQAI